MSLFKHLIRNLIIISATAFCIAITATALLFFYTIEFLPDTNTLKDVHLQVPLQIYTQDHKLIAEYGEKRRIPITFKQIPKGLIYAVLAIEDKSFFKHGGIDFSGLARAAIKLIATGEKAQGGSTITMQVARNFFLTRKKTYTRKMKEILLAIKIDHEFDKYKILELYFNKIFFGHRAYGAAAAAEVYYGKTLDQLNLAQYAMLAGIPKAPSILNPLSNPEAAIKRRNQVLRKMFELKFISEATYQRAINEPVTASYHEHKVEIKAPYFAELVRQKLEKLYGPQIYSEGFDVVTTLKSDLQPAANSALRHQLLLYDKRHGYRGAEQNLGQLPEDLQPWREQLAQITTINSLEPAVVTKINDKDISVLAVNNTTMITIPWENLKWARKRIDQDHIGPRPKNASDIVQIGDVIRIEKAVNGSWQLSQIPAAEAAIVSINPMNGAVLALSGGFDFYKNKFNHATQAQRQTGSSFKPFVYAAALAKGFTLASIINDAPVVLSDTGINDYWRPQNDTHLFYGPTRLRQALLRSRNLVSVRLLQLITIPYAVDYVTRFGFERDLLPRSLSLALGSAATTPLQLALSYAVFANQGYNIKPYFVDHITNAKNKIISQAEPIVLRPSLDSEILENAAIEHVIDPKIAFLMTTALQDVIKYGTGRQALNLRRPDIAGKTGTTNEQFDAWFAGYNSHIATVTWIGFDQPQSLHEYAASSALPMWIEFMRTALKNIPVEQLKQPPGITTALINPKTGKRVKANDKRGRFEYFRTENLPEYETTSDFHNDDRQDNDSQVDMEMLY